MENESFIKNLSRESRNVRKLNGPTKMIRLIIVSNARQIDNVFFLPKYGLSIKYRENAIAGVSPRIA